jgi:hypothetical protein
MSSVLDADMQKILSWLHSPDPSMTHNRLVEEHHEGTGEWFLKSEKFVRWKETPCAILWIKGIRTLSAILWKCLGTHWSTDCMLYSRKWEERTLVRNIA